MFYELNEPAYEIAKNRVSFHTGAHARIHHTPNGGHGSK